MNLIQQIIHNFSMSELYVFTAWFMIVGAIGRMLVTFWLMPSRQHEVIQATLRLHSLSVLIGYILAPIAASLSVICLGAGCLHVSNASSIAKLYGWYGLAVILAYQALSCASFVSVKCSIWQKYLLCIDGLVLGFGAALFWALGTF